MVAIFRHGPGKDRLRVEGRVLDEFTDLAPLMGLAYFKGVQEFSCTGLLARPALIFARCHSVFDVLAPDNSVPLRLDAYATMLVPPGVPFKMMSVTSVSQATILCPGRSLLTKAAGTYGIPPATFLNAFKDVRVLKRTNWVNEIMHRYVYERVVAGNSANEAASFLESEIVKEIYFLLRKPGRGKNVFSLDGTGRYDNPPLLKRALDYIETNLFSDITMAALAKNSFASEATLLRIFAHEFKSTPFNYILNRRLDESLALLRNRKYSVGEVSDLIGYKTLSGFIAAFKERFRCTPLAWRKKRESLK